MLLFESFFLLEDFQQSQQNIIKMEFIINAFNIPD